MEDFGKSRDLCADFMINHVSAQSTQFKDFAEKGDEVRARPTSTSKLCYGLLTKNKATSIHCTGSKSLNLALKQPLHVDAPVLAARCAMAAHTGWPASGSI